jgi:STE24 endopeptidase
MVPAENRVSVSNEPRARRYQRWRLWLSIARSSLAAIYLAALVATGTSAAVRNWASTVTDHWWLAFALALIAMAVGYRILALPFSWLGGFWLPRRFGLLHQPLHLWLWDAVKAALIGGLLGLIGAEIAYALLRATPWWWLWGAGVFLAIAAALAWVTPTWLVPLFYRMVPLEVVALRERLIRLAERAGVPVLGVWVADQSRKSRTANAAVIGLRGTRRILLFDTLVTEFTPDEVEVVLAHELAHQVHGDVGRGLLVQGAVMLAAFWIADRCLRAATQWAGLSGPADIAGLPLFGLVLMGVGLLALPLVNGWSRRVERQADDFALHTASNPAAFIDAMERLAALNLAERDPHPAEEFLLYSHPSIGRRISHARQVLHLAG